MANDPEMDSQTEKGTDTDLSAAYHQRHPLSGAYQLPMTQPATPLSPLEDRVQRVLALAE